MNGEKLKHKICEPQICNEKSEYKNMLLIIFGNINVGNINIHRSGTNLAKETFRRQIAINLS